ncbi:ligase-associated DNA damage response endonuclease PdeM [Paracoccus sp. (in: a-proteobacteria)]|uniref:ligase-associated DNA damage response endonuclease PdeM n=1 Tax=Paracoccus sp. TaxID=267 RepID=UPI003A843E37
MTSYGLEFAGEPLEARASGALFWPARRWLIVADLHLGKSERIARRGGPLLPPYEVQATLERLRAEIGQTDPVCVVSLGDGFDDDAAVTALPEPIRRDLHSLAQGRDWLWISGNHDPAPVGAHLPGRTCTEVSDRLILRHQAGAGPDISGHYHPCIRLAGQRRRCFAIGRNHLILPAFGAYTGGLDIADPALTALVPHGLAVVCGTRALALPLPQRKAGESATRQQNGRGTGR